MFTEKEISKFFSLRERLFKLIEEELSDEDGVHKSYEGNISIYVPGYFDKYYGIRLDCYVLDDGYWSGETFKEVLDKFELTIKAWESGERD